MSVYFLGKGAGDIYIKAECTFVSETYSIEDCYKFDSLTSDKNLFSVTSGSATINYSNDGVTITGTTSTETHIVADFTLPSSDYEITYDVNAITSASDGYTLHSCFEDLLLGHNRYGFYARKVSVSGDIWGGGSYYNPPCTMKLEVSGTTTKTIAVYRNNSQIKTTLTGINKTGVMQFISYANGRGLTLKNLKIKPL